MIITLADKGLVAFAGADDMDLIQAQHFPALAVNPLDVVGAGDSLLSGLAISRSAGAGLMEAAALASGVASIAVNKIGNVPVRFEEMDQWLNSIKDCLL